MIEEEIKGNYRQSQRDQVQDDELNKSKVIVLNQQIQQTINVYGIEPPLKHPHDSESSEDGQEDHSTY